MKIYGIDVSHHQGVIDWRTVASELRRVNNNTSNGFAILRVGYSNRNGKGGLQMDGQILANLKGCAANGIPIGVYCYCYDTSEQAARITMSQVLNLIKDYRVEYPVIYDIEYGTNDGSAWNGSNYKYDDPSNRINNTRIISSAMETVEQAKYYGMVYASRDFFINYTSLPDIRQFDAWEAAYTSVDTDTVQNGIWQYSSKNALGIAGFGDKLDCNVAYKDYPSIIRAAGLNNFGKTEKPSMVVNENGLWRVLFDGVSKGDKDFLVRLADGLKVSDRTTVMSVA